MALDKPGSTKAPRPWQRMKSNNAGNYRRTERFDTDHGSHYP
jgi:hypothetical protein